MFCMECGQEILDRSGFCPVCGAVVKYSIISDAKADTPSRAVGPTKKRTFYGMAHQDIAGRVDNANERLSSVSWKTMFQQRNLFFYTGVGVVIVGMMQFIIFDPLLKSGFSVWNYYSYMRGIPLFIGAMLPYAMVACEFLIIVAGVVGFCFAGWKGAAGFYKISGIVSSVSTSSLLVVRIVYRHVEFLSVGGGNQKSFIPETSIMFQEQYLRSLYPIFIFAAMTTVLSFFCIYGSTRLGKASHLNAGKAMTVAGICGFSGSICGMLFGKYAGEMIPLVAAWSAVAFGVMTAVGIVGLSNRQNASVRAFLGLAQLTVFTLCMLQTIHHAYSAIVHGCFFNNLSFVMIAVLAGTLAVSTILSAFYISDIDLKNLMK